MAASGNGLAKVVERLVLAKADVNKATEVSMQVHVYALCNDFLN